MSKITNTFYKNAIATPQKLAIRCEKESLTYQELSELVNKWSQLMLSNGVKYKDKVGVLLPNNIEFIALMLVASNLGVALVPLNPLLPLNAIDKAFVSSGVKHVIGTQATLDNINPAIITCADGLWLCIDGECPHAKNFQKLLKTESCENIANEHITGDEPLILTMTSGSTGNPKPINLTQNNKYDRAFAAVELYDITKDDIILAATPLYHSLAERLVLLPLLTGGTSVLMPRFSSSLWVKTIKDESVSFTIAVSSQLRQIATILASPFLPDIKSLRCIVSSSALLEPHIKAELVAKLKCDFHECYGASEIAIASNLNIIDSKSKMKSVGKAAPNVDIKILKKDKTFAKPNETGEIICKTPMLFGGYYQMPELTQNAMFGEYFCTGDIGYLDGDDFLYFLDRQKDIIITGGINVYPSDIEDVILKLDSVKECAAFPFPEKNLGEVIAVAIVAKNPLEFKKKEVKFHCAKHLADFQQPRKYFIVDQLPKNSMGKLTKHTLVTEFTKT